jgi:hypothetical protein
MEFSLVLDASFGECGTDITDGSDLCSTPLKCPNWHDIHIPSFMKIGTGVQAMLTFFPQKYE